MSLRERLKIKKTKEEELGSTLIRVKRESRYAYEDLKEGIKELKEELREDEVDSAPKADAKLWLKMVKTINRMSRMIDTQSDSETEV